MKVKELIIELLEMDLNEEIRIIPLENLPENSDCTIKHIESYGSNRKVDLEVELK